MEKKNGKSKERSERVSLWMPCETEYKPDEIWCWFSFQLVCDYANGKNNNDSRSVFVCNGRPLIITDAIVIGEREKNKNKMLFLYCSIVMNT